MEILASWYSDSASLQMGGPVRNSDLELAPFTDVPPRKAVRSAEAVLDAVVDIQANLRRELVRLMSDPPTAERCLGGLGRRRWRRRWRWRRGWRWHRRDCGDRWDDRSADRMRHECIVLGVPGRGVALRHRF